MLYRIELHARSDLAVPLGLEPRPSPLTAERNTDFARAQSSKLGGPQGTRTLITPLKRRLLYAIKLTTQVVAGWWTRTRTLICGSRDRRAADCTIHQLMATNMVGEEGLEPSSQGSEPYDTTNWSTRHLCTKLLPRPQCVSA